MAVKKSNLTAAKKKRGMKVGTPILKIPKALLAAIGDVISMWSILENTSCYITAAAFGQSDKKLSRILFVQMDWLGKLEVLKLLCKRYDAIDAIAALERIERESDKLRQLRNRLAHGVWSRLHKGRKTLHIVQYRGSADGLDMRVWPRRTFPKTKQINEAAEKIRKLDAEIESWYAKHMREISPNAVPVMP